MKKLGLLLAATVLIYIGAMAQKAEVLYFKANLPCCPAKACNNLENDVKEIVAKNFKSDEVSFKQVKLTDETNKPTIELHNAKSQTVVIVSKKKKKKETAVDVSDIVRKYSRSQNKTELESELIAKINECIK